MSRVLPYIQLMRLERPIGILLLLWPTLWALWIAAGGLPNLKVLIIFILGTIVMRSAGCVINDIADRRWDGSVKRTVNRPLVTGAVSLKGAWLLFGALCLIGLILVLELNNLTILLSFGALALLILYPFTKRITHLPQLVLGAAFAWSIPMAFAAQLGHIPPITWLIYAIGVLWPVIYDTFYAMADREDDVKVGIRSTAILFGRFDRLITGILQLLMLVLLLILGGLLDLKITYFPGIVLAAGLMYYQQWLIRKRDPILCLKAFSSNQWLGFVVFLAIIAGL